MTYQRMGSAASSCFCCVLLQLLLLMNTVMPQGIGHKAFPPKMDPKVTLPPVTHKVYLRVEIDGADVGKLVLGLFGTVAPKTVENFRSLCACDNTENTKLCYKGSTFHRIIPNFMIQGGDIIRNDGTGGDSIYGGTFDDETFKVTFNRKFLLAMANSGTPNSNASQFFITTVKTQWLTGKHVVFGKVMDESETVVKTIEKEGTNGGIPRADKIVIVDSGEIKLSSGPIEDDGNDPHHNRDIYEQEEQEQEEPQEKQHHHQHTKKEKEEKEQEGEGDDGGDDGAEEEEEEEEGGANNEEEEEE